jgi:predicted ATPase
MIEHIEIENFKSIGKVSVDLSPVTVLIGRSGVGKSNFLRAIRFLRNYLLNPEQAVQQEGGWQQIWPSGVPRALALKVRFRLPGFEEPFTYSVTWGFIQGGHPLQQPPIVEVEHLDVGGRAMLDRAREKITSVVDSGTPSRASDLRRLCVGNFPTISEAVLTFAAWTNGVGWHDFPARVLTSASQPNREAQANGLDDNAQNYLFILRDLTQDLRNQHARKQILARLKQINSTLLTVELNDLRNPQHVVVGHQLGSHKVALDLSQESDGLRRYYAHLLALYQTPPKQVLMFEEPENGIYPGALKNLAEEFIAAPPEQRGQVLLSTQSPDLLDGFGPEQIRVVDLDPDNQQTRIGPLDSDQADALRESLLEPGELLTVDTPRIAQTADGGANAT